MDCEHTKITRAQVNEKLQFHTAGKEVLLFFC